MDLVSGDIKLQMFGEGSSTVLPDMSPTIRSCFIFPASGSSAVCRAHWLRFGPEPSRHRPTISSQDYGQKILQSRPYGLPLTLRFMRYPYSVTIEEPFPPLPNRLQAHYARAAPSSEYPVMCSDRLASFLPPAFHGMSPLCRPLLFKKTVARVIARDIHPRQSHRRAPRRSFERR